MERVLPTTEAEVAEIIRDASNLDRTVQVVGGGLSIGTGNLVPEADIALDTTALTGIEDYVPSDLTLRVMTGTRVADLQAELARHGQEIPLDVPFPDQTTIGGLVATGFAGPRRFAIGTLKDLLIGASFVRGDGLAAKAGGMVVKNVSGFELPRLMHGSWGALAVLTSVNLKVLPKPKAEATLTWDLPGADVKQTAAQAQLCLLRVPGLTAVTVERRDVVCQVAIRVMGREAAVSAQLQELGSFLGITDAHELRGAESAAFWQAQTNRWAVAPEDAVQISLGGTAQNLSSTLTLDSVFDNSDLLIQPGLGSVKLQTRKDLDQVKAWWQARTANPTFTGIVEAAPMSWRDGIDVWGPETDARQLMRSVKQEFDPGNILNRGRLFV